MQFRSRTAMSRKLYTLAATCAWRAAHHFDTLQSSPWGQQDLAPFAILQELLGGGNAVSSAPGVGLTSRLSQQVVQQNPYVESCAAFSTSYSDSGLFGVYGVVQPEKAGEMAMSILQALGGLTEVSDMELTKAKAMLKGKLFRQVDEDQVLMQDMAQQLLLGNQYGSPKDFAGMIDAVTVGEVTAAARKILSSKPTVAAYGDTHTVPHYSAVEAALRG